MLRIALTEVAEFNISLDPRLRGDDRGRIDKVDDKEIDLARTL